MLPDFYSKIGGGIGFFQAKLIEEGIDWIMMLIQLILEKGRN